MVKRLMSFYKIKKILGIGCALILLGGCTPEIPEGDIKDFVDAIDFDNTYEKVNYGKSVINVKHYLSEENLAGELTITTYMDKTDDKYNIPTTKAVWDAIESYEGLLEDVSLAKPKPTNTPLKDLREPGYYLYKRNDHFSYGGESINCKNALIEVKRDYVYTDEGKVVKSNRTIQHVYATSKITTSDGTVYKINGSEYTRWGTSSSDWKAWQQYGFQAS